MNTNTAAPALVTRNEPGTLLNRGAVLPGPVADQAPQPEASPETRSAAPSVVTRAAVNQEIRALATTFDLGSDWANGLIDRAASEGEARAAALDSLRTRGAATPNLAPRISAVATLDPDPSQIALRMAEAVYATRVNLRHKLSEQARPYAGLTTLDMARECCRRAGISTVGLSPSDTVTRALSTSDYPVIFADTANRTLRAAYDAAPSGLKAVARQTTARDFRKKTAVQISEAPTLLKVEQGAEYEHGAYAESKETYGIATFGRIVSLTRQAIINDDLGAFADLAGKFGQAATDFEAQFLVDLLVQNSGLGPTMDDTKTLFHADHGNVAASGGYPSVATLGAARLKLRRQTGLAGRPVSVVPAFLVVPPELESAAEAVLTAITPATVDDVNPFSGKLQVIVEPRLSDDGRWYVTAAPGSIDGLEYAYLQGAEGPQTETKVGFEVDGIAVKVRLDFGAAFLDWRGWYTNEGV